jgi:hypothetical protein
MLRAEDVSSPRKNEDREKISGRLVSLDFRGRARIYGIRSARQLIEQLDSICRISGASRPAQDLKGV